MKSNKKVMKIALGVFLIAIIFGIYFLSNEFFKVKRDTKLVEMKLPAETQNLIMGTEVVKLQKGKGEDSVLITGWVIKQNVKEKKKSVYLVLESKNDTLVFELGNSNLTRPDVKQYYHLDEGIDNHGFEMSFLRSYLKESKYHIGFIIDDETGRHFAMSAKSLRISNDAIALIDFKPESDTVMISIQVPLTVKASTGKIQVNIESIKKSDSTLNITGWGFLQGMNADSLKSYILLKKNEKLVYFTVNVNEREDVTKHFKESRLDLDSSGIIALIPTKSLEKGHYLVGLYIERGNQAGLIYTDKYVDIDN